MMSSWNSYEYDKLKQELLSYKDSDEFLDFSKKLIFTKYEMIGIRIPVLRKLAKRIVKTNIDEFLSIAKDTTYEEVLLQGLVISYIKDYSIFLKYFEKFILKIDNWAICDSCISSMKVISNNKEEMLKNVKRYLNNKHEFIVRVGLIILLYYYIDDYYIDEIFNLIDKINREEYYINMAIAWLGCECYIKYREKTMKYLKNNHLNKFTYQKLVQKILESNRVSKSDKENFKRKKA